MTTWPDKTANGKTLISPVAINFQGMVLVFAREAETPVEYLYYNVRVPGSTPGSAPPWSPLWADDDAWETDEWVGWSQLLMQEDSTGADSVPMIRVGGLDLITLPLARLPLTDTKATNISTPARADFQVASDGQYISIFRSTTNRTLFMDRFVLVEGQGPQTGSSGPTTTWTLQRAWEVRYQRSGQRDVAASAKDTPSSTNMLSRPFLEPTTELAFGTPVHDNQFTVVLAPTAAGGWRWHFFMVEEEASFLHHASYAQDATGRVLMDHGKIDALEMSALLSDPTTNDPVVRPLPALRGVGPAAVIYHEQEAGVTSNGTPTTVGRAARLMVVQTVVAGFGTTGTDSSIFAILDFQVNPDGTIAVPEKTPLLEGIDRQTTASGYNYLTPANGGFIIPPAAVHSVGSGTFMAAYYWKPWADRGRCCSTEVMAWCASTMRQVRVGPTPARSRSSSTAPSSRAPLPGSPGATRPATRACCNSSRSSPARPSAGFPSASAIAPAVWTSARCKSAMAPARRCPRRPGTACRVSCPPWSPC